MRKIAIKVTELINKYALKCGHCKTLIIIFQSQLEEVDRINLSNDSAEITYNFDCTRCKGENQVKVFVDSKSEDYRS